MPISEFVANDTFLKRVWEEICVVTTLHQMRSVQNKGLYTKILELRAFLQLPKIAFRFFINAYNNNENMN